MDDTTVMIATMEEAAVTEVRELLQVPGFSATGEGMRESAAACLRHLESIATDAQIVETSGHPVVFGRSLSPVPDAPTLLVYALYDMTPVGPDAWTVDPTGAEIVPAEMLGLPPEMGDVICSRAAQNHRGPMLAAILGVKAMLEAGEDLPVNLVWVWEGEEEIGSPHLDEFIEEFAGYLKDCDALWMPCMFQDFGGQMPLHRGTKGQVLLELSCAGGEWGGALDGRHIWPGWMPWVDAPLMNLVHAVGSLYDDDHRVAIDGLAEAIPAIDPADEQQIDELRGNLGPEYDAAVKREIGVARLRGGRSIRDSLDRYVGDIGINLQGVTGGYVGPDFYTMLPQRATAKLDLRIPQGMRPDDIMQMVRTHLDRHGHPEVEIRTYRGYEGYRSDIDSAVNRAAIDAATDLGVDTSIWPTHNACAPIGKFTALLPGLPCSSVGLGAGGRSHAPDEYICVGAVKDMMEFTVAFLRRFGA